MPYRGLGNQNQSNLARETINSSRTVSVSSIILCTAAPIHISTRQTSWKHCRKVFGLRAYCSACTNSLFFFGCAACGASGGVSFVGYHFTVVVSIVEYRCVAYHCWSVDPFHPKLVPAIRFVCTYLASNMIGCVVLFVLFVMCFHPQRTPLKKDNQRDFIRRNVLGCTGCLADFRLP